MSATLDKNADFYYSLDLAKYAGKWIAIVDQKIVAIGKSFKEVYSKTQKEYPGKRPLFDRVSEARHHFLK